MFYSKLKVLYDTELDILDSILFTTIYKLIKTTKINKRTDNNSIHRHKL